MWDRKCVFFVFIYNCSFTLKYAKSAYLVGSPPWSWILLVELKILPRTTKSVPPLLYLEKYVVLIDHDLFGCGKIMENRFSKKSGYPQMPRIECNGVCVVSVVKGCGTAAGETATASTFCHVQSLCSHHHSMHCLAFRSQSVAISLQGNHQRGNVREFYSCQG